MQKDLNKYYDSLDRLLGRLTMDQIHLIHDYLDAEQKALSLGLLPCLKLKLLNLSSSAAREYAAYLSELKLNVEQSVSGQELTISPQKSADELWQGISQRIASEKRAAVYLGQRGESKELSSEYESAKKLAFSSGSFWPGLALASMALCLGLVFHYNVLESPVQSDLTLAKSDQSPEQSAGNANRSPVIAANQVSTVSAGGNRSFRNRGLSGTARSSAAAQRELNSRINRIRSLELDWIRSDRSVQILEDDEQGANIIWIKKPRVSYYEIPNY